MTQPFGGCDPNEGLPSMEPLITRRRRSVVIGQRRFLIFAFPPRWRTERVSSPALAELSTTNLRGSLPCAATNLSKGDVLLHNTDVSVSLRSIFRVVIIDTAE